VPIITHFDRKTSGKSSMESQVSLVRQEKESNSDGEESASSLSREWDELVLFRKWRRTHRRVKRESSLPTVNTRRADSQRYLPADREFRFGSDRRESCIVSFSVTWWDWRVFVGRRFSHRTKLPSMLVVYWARPTVLFFRTQPTLRQACRTLRQETHSQQLEIPSACLS
jgi:transposase-like protein